ncbi:DegT/DnrJ/EryC1/StrS aminotransferase family protein [Clostridium botulinum]|nr:DegT/DnrJ/EryC1/StrS aminotransferase family protein [Clostridium botulinum]NFS95621.1 DegT/DnrJ/EryC1/StrS aminotransferase family protein [Clostridium botulinum]
MARHLKTIGGEHWFDTDLFNEKLNNFANTQAVFLSGGQSAIRFILKEINLKNHEYILMPSYLCPSILYNFQSLNIKYKFYKINADLSIDLNDIKDKIYKNNIKSVFFINYFGFYHNEKTINYLKKLKGQDITIIEDAVQMLWFERKEFIGDYVFNSYRKFLPIDGAIVLCNKTRKYKFTEDTYSINVRFARLKKTFFNKFGIGSEYDFLKLYEKAEEEYYKRKEIIGMDSESRNLLSKVDYEFILKKRKKNYSYLYDKLKCNNKIKMIYDKKTICNNSVLGLPILIKNRNEVREKLRKLNIYCPVHWDITKECWSSGYVDSRYLSERILTLPIDQRYSFEDMNKLNKAINKVY